MNDPYILISTDIGVAGGVAPLGPDGKVPAENIPAGGGSITEHGKLKGRDLPDQHTMGAITGLETALAEKADTGYVNSTFSNAIKVTETGPVIATDMVSPVEHDVECKVESKNLIYGLNSVAEQDGITITTNPDGTFTINSPSGATKNTSIALLTRWKPSDFGLELGVPYTFSGCPAGGSKETYSFGIYSAKAVINASEFGAGDSIVFSEDIPNYGFYISVQQGVKLTNVVFKPQLEKGSVKTSYAPYLPSVEGVTVSQIGTQLFNLSAASDRSNWDSLGGGVYSSFKIPAGRGKRITVSYDGVLSTGLGILCYVGKKNQQSSTGNDYGWLYHTSAGSLIHNELSFTAEDDYVYLMVNVGGAFQKFLDKIGVSLQAQLGEKTKYETYSKNDFPVSVEGLVSGMTSISPNMTILTDNAGAALDVTYNADTKKYIDKKFAELQAAVVAAGAI